MSETASSLASFGHSPSSPVWEVIATVTAKGHEPDRVDDVFGRLAAEVVGLDPDMTVGQLRSLLSSGCTCGFGGFHDDINPRCVLNASTPENSEEPK